MLEVLAEENKPSKSSKPTVGARTKSKSKNNSSASPTFIALPKTGGEQSQGSLPKTARILPDVGYASPYRSKSPRIFDL